MRYIGFKNFRRFAELDPIDLAPVSIFVGGNNSGKSTVVKGILEIRCFLQKECDYDVVEVVSPEESGEGAETLIRHVSHNQRFSFNADYYAHIGTSKRALRCGADSKDITFRFGLNYCDYEIVVHIDDESDESTSGQVTHFNISAPGACCEIRSNLLDWKATLILHPDNPQKYCSDNPNYDQNPAFFDVRSSYFSRFNKDVIIELELPDRGPDSVGRVSSDTLIRFLIDAVETTVSASITSVADMMDNMSFRRRSYFNIKNIALTDEQRELIKNSPYWRDEGWGFRFPIHDRRVNIQYVYAHAVTQSVIYSAKDTNDYLVKTVHDFANCHISQHSKGKKKDIYSFITRWMQAFNIGFDYTVKSIGGEAHIVKIKNLSGDFVNMADMGMGSIQLMVLLYRIGVILDQAQSRSTTIILEEPEQNLHPKLQSLLADLLLELNRNYGLRFIVETHSEYLIRKTQVLVGEQYNDSEKLKDNPFRVFYFPSHGQPYDMEYTESGTFAQPFGEGFFDEAATLHMAVLRNSRK